MNREDFLMLNKDIIYFDNGATTLKPKIVIDSMIDYYANYTANTHSNDYTISMKVNEKYEESREIVKKFINAKDSKEIVFTSGTTDSLNKIVFGYFKNKLNENDEILITKSEHASNVLTWFKLEKENKIKVKYIELTSDHKVTIENVMKSININTKVISIAHITNVVGDIRPLRQIINYAHQNNILVVVDGAQSVPHLKIDVQDLDIDFLAFSAHKMCGPTGVGALYAKYELLEELEPTTVGGGMNFDFSSDKNLKYSKLPQRLESGTPNIAGVIGFGEAIKYIEKIGLYNISNYEYELKKYAISKLTNISNLKIYNQTSESGIITINYNNILAQDLAIYLNRFNICVRAGNHCAKILKDELGINDTCRISLYFYNTKEEIDKLVEVLGNPNILNEII